ncbi:MAG: DNRLRE domain-containing protein, partial [Thermoanaerobaculaceae bacterium]|nr:DNRLRE domain-containing protein [Thermoanaerobaculaceae bacterium]
MKKIFLLLIALFSSSLLAQRFDTQFKNDAEGMFFEGGDFNFSSYKFVLSGFELEKIEAKEGEFLIVKGLDGDATSKIGYPQLPVKRVLIEIPYGSVPDLEITDETYIDYDLKSLGYDFPVYPKQPSVVKLPEAERSFVFDKEFYSADCFYPEETMKVEDEAYLRAHRILNVLIQPFKYNPATNTLRIYTSFTLNLKTQNGLKEATIKEHQRTYSKSYEDYLSQKILNYGMYDVSGQKTSYFEGLLIITHGNFNTAELASYAEFKRKWGYKVQIATLAETGSTSTAIKSYIQNAYNTWSNPSLSYVMLVGAYEYVTATNMTVGDSATKTDLYYTTLSGGDILPYVHLARMTISSTSELSTVLTRLTNYSLGNFTSTSWIDYISFLGTCDSSYYTIAEGTHNYCVTNYTNPWGYTGTFPNNPQAGGDKLYCVTYSASNQNCIDRFNAGRSIVTHSGHCGPTYFAGPYIYVSDVQNLTNGEKTPFVVGHCCQSNQWEGSSLTVGEAWLQKAAVGYWGSVDYTYWDEDDLLQKYWYNEVYSKGYFKVGQFTDLAKIDFYNNPGGSSLVTYYLEEYNLNGDPTQEIWTKQPQILTVEHDSAMAVGTTAFSVIVKNGSTPVQGALVCFYKQDENIHEVAATDSSGVATLNFNPITSLTGNASIMVTKHDFKPYQNNISVIAPTGPYLVYNGRGNFVEIEGDGDSYFDKGEKWSVEVMVKNVGNQTGTDCYATLNGNGIEVCIPSKSFGTLLAEASGSAVFEFVISPSFETCGGAVNFNIINKSCNELSPAGSNQENVFSIKIGKKTPGTSQTIAIQPSSSDTYLDQANPSVINGSLGNISVQNQRNSARRGLIKFNLSSIPSNATITNAQLELYCYAYPSTAQTINLHLATSDWSEASANWTNMNNQYNTTAIASLDCGKTTGWKIWTGLGSTVQGWVNGSIGNYGLMLKCASETSSSAQKYEFGSNNYAVAAQRPILRVSYTTPEIWECSYVGSGECEVIILPGEIADGSSESDAITFTDVNTIQWPAGSPPITGYRLYRGLQSNLANLLNGNQNFCKKYEGANTSADISLDNPSSVEGNCYYYLVTAYNGAGEGS